jgi:outer membrane protein OmpA-like peptidoglycan-associated protein
MEMNMFFFNTKTTPKFALSFLVVVLGSCQMIPLKQSETTEPTSKKPVSSQPQVSDKKPIPILISRHRLPEWQKKVQLANQARQQKQWNKATRLYNEALDLINDERATLQAPGVTEIQEIIRLASYSQLLGDTTRKRSLNSCNTLMRTKVRGVEITQHLFPVQFAFNSTKFTPKGKINAEQLARCLKNKGQNLSQITLIGHTDEIGGASYNYTLSQQRAKALKSYLRGKGIVFQVKTEGRGEAEPLNNLPPELTLDEIHQLNRRVEVRTN